MSSESATSRSSNASESDSIDSSNASSMSPNAEDIRGMLREAEEAFDVARKAKAEQGKIKPGTKGGGKAAKKAVADAYKAAKMTFMLRKKQLDDIISRQDSQANLVVSETASAIAKCHLHSTAATSLDAVTAISFSPSASYVQSMLIPEVDSTSSTESSDDEDMVEDHIMETEGNISTKDTTSITVQGIDSDTVAEIEPEMLSQVTSGTNQSPNLTVQVAQVQPGPVESRDTVMADVTSSSTATPAIPMDLLSMPDLHHDDDDDEDDDTDDDEEDNANANATATADSDDDSDDADDSSEDGSHHGSTRVPRLTRIPVFLRMHGEKMSSTDKESDGMNFADFARMHPDDQELVATAGRDAIRRWLRNPKHSTLDHRLRRLIREHQSFLPEMASQSRELALIILTTNCGNIICPYHHRWDKAGTVVDGKGKYKINGVPYSRHVSKTKRQRVQRPEGHLHCGCEEDAVLMDFYFWKTWEIKSATGSHVEGLGDDMFKPRTRAFVTSQVTDLTGLVAEDFFKKGLSRREFEKKRVLIQLEYLMDYLNDICQPENQVYSLNVTEPTSTT
ncbi:hypothetical protein H0H92_000225 [Tricholoma furcatifolium]|nr:hypothetical protein H0H92_000225 [Tricholoma furcatifolium]